MLRMDLGRFHKEYIMDDFGNMIDYCIIDMHQYIGFMFGEYQFDIDHYMVSSH